MPRLQSITFDPKKKECQKIIKYHKYTFFNKEFEDYNEFKTNVFFETDLEKIAKNFKDHDTKVTCGELLTGFFDFYWSRYNPGRHAITIGHDPSIMTKHDYVLELQRAFKDESA